MVDRSNPLYGTLEVMRVEVVPLVKEYLIQKYFRRFKTRQALEAYQEKMMKKHLQFVLQHSPFYREYYGVEHAQEITDWRSLPIIDKQIMMEHFSTLNTVGIDRDEAFALAIRSEEERNFSPTIHGITVGLSSGTSGNRGLFIVSPEERKRWAGVILAKLLPGPLWRKQRIAFFLRANSNLYTTTKSKQIHFEFFDLLLPLEQHINRLNDFQPTILVGPPSLLRFLSERVEEGKLNIQPIKIISVAEVLDPLDEKYIENIFQQRIHQVYQCTEGFLGCTCEHGTLHLNEDILIIQKEYTDKNRFMPIITDFSRKSQPILRYRLNDILTERMEPCPCGAPTLALEKIEGRSDDIFYFKRGQEEVPIFPDFIRRTIITASDEIEEYRVIQTGMDTIELQIKWKDREETEKVEASLISFLKKQQLEIPTIQWKDYNFSPGGVKLRRIERRMS